MRIGNIQFVCNVLLLLVQGYVRLQRRHGSARQGGISGPKLGVGGEQPIKGPPTNTAPHYEHKPFGE
jgi:hypothetical protein